jgi:TPR repeat protein
METAEVSNVRNNMRGVLRALVAFAIASICVGADFQAGKLAYERGDYAAALELWIPVAERGDRQAQRQLGELYRDGKGTPADKIQSLRWYRLASAQGDTKASFEVVHLCTPDEFFTYDLPDACRQVAEGDSEYRRIYGEIRTLAERGDAEAQFMLSMIMQTILSHDEYRDKDNGSKLTPKGREAHKWLHDAAKQGYAPAGVAIVDTCWLMWTFKDDAGRLMIDADWWGLNQKECLDILNSLTQRIDDLGPDDQYRVGLSYTDRPDGNSALGVAFMEKAAMRGSIVAKQELGRIFYEGSLVPKDYPKAARWYRDLLESKSVLALDFQKTPPFTRTTIEAFRMVRLASERLGYLYSGVAGIPINDQEASRWFLGAAAMGSADAQRSMAFRCRDGLGVPKSLPGMARWFLRAAEQGDVQSQYMLGTALYVGKGVPQDFLHAHMWLNLAAASGNSQAASLRDGVAKEMSAEQIGEAQALAAGWHPRPDPADIAAPREVQ